MNTHIHKHEHTRIHTAVWSHLKGLEAEAHIVSFGHGDPPHTLLGGSVVVGIVGRLDLPGVFGDFPPTDRCTD